MPQRDKPQVLKLQAPRAGRTWLVLASLCAALGSAAGYLSDVPARWQRLGGTSLALFAVVLLIWRFLPASRLQIVLPASDDAATYLVELRRPDAPAILIGRPVGVSE